MFSSVALLALAAVASARVAGPVTVPCGSDGAHGSVGRIGTRSPVPGAESAKCFVGGVAWAVAADAAAGEVAIRDVRVEGDGISIASAPSSVELLLEGVVVRTSTAEAIGILGGEASLTVRDSDVHMMGNAGYAIYGSVTAAGIHITGSFVGTTAAGDACGKVYAIGFNSSATTVVVENSTVDAQAYACSSAEAVAIEAGNVTIKTSFVNAWAPDKAIAASLHTETRRAHAPTGGWLVVEGSRLGALVLSGGPATGVEAVGMQLSSSTIEVTSEFGTSTAVRVAPSADVKWPVSVAASTLAAAGREALGLLWAGGLHSRLELGAGTNVSGPVIVEGDVTGDIVLNGVTVTAAAGPALDVRGAVSGTLEFGVTAAASLVTPAVPPVNVMRFAEPCSVTFGAFPADFAALEPLLNRTVGVCNVTVPQPVPETDAKRLEMEPTESTTVSKERSTDSEETTNKLSRPKTDSKGPETESQRPVSGAAAFPLPGMFAAVLVTAAAVVFA